MPTSIGSTSCWASHPAKMTDERRIERHMSIVVVVAGGEPPPLSLGDQLPPAAVVIAADSGLDHARLLGLEPTMLIGDLDSISADGLHWAQEHDVEIVRHPRDKDATDLELAIEAAGVHGNEIVVVDGGEGRFDHGLGNLLLLSSPRWQELQLDMVRPDAHISVIRHSRTLLGEVGDIVSLMAVGGDAMGLTTTGLRWPLSEATLEAGSSLGISNEFCDSQAMVTLGSGVVFAVQPTA